MVAQRPTTPMEVTATWTSRALLCLYFELRGSRGCAHAGGLGSYFEIMSLQFMRVGHKVTSRKCEAQTSKVSTLDPGIKAPESGLSFPRLIFWELTAVGAVGAERARLRDGARRLKARPRADARQAPSVVTRRALRIRGSRPRPPSVGGRHWPHGRTN